MPPSPLIRFAALLLVSLCVLTGSVRADRLIFQRADALYVTDEEGKDTPRRLLVLPTGPDILWAAAPDGRRIAWVTRAGSREGSAGSDNLAVRPLAVYLGDMTGRRSKRLFRSDDLRDRQGRKVTALGDIAGGEESGSSGTSLNEWRPVSLAWSADARTLYVSCAFLSATNANIGATFAVDALTGIALVDAEGRWKPIAPLMQVDARGPLVVGVVPERLAPEGGTSAETAYHPLYLLNFADGTRTSLLSGTGLNRANLPAYAFAAAPALSPDRRRIALAAVPPPGSEGGLWVADRQAKTYLRLVEGRVARPRWTSEGANILYLAPSEPAATTLDLMRILAAMPTGAAAPVRVLSDILWFDVVPD